MPARTRLQWLLLGALLVSSSTAAQTGNALPLPPGVVRLGAGGGYSIWNSRYGSGGDTEPLGAPFSVPLGSDNFAPLAAAGTALNLFFRGTDAATGGTGAIAATADNLTLGSLTLRAAAERTRVPLALELGLLRRLSFRVGASLERERTETHQLTLAGGSVGLNPDPSGNAAALAEIDSAYAALGASALLPLDSSALGRELVRRAEVLGVALQLPSTPVDRQGFEALLGTEALRSEVLDSVRVWRLRTAQVGVRLQLLGADDRAPTAHRGVRSAAVVDLRFPVDRTGDVSPLLLGMRGGETVELSTALRNDLIFGRRLWLSANGAYTWRGTGSVERRVGAAGEPFPPAAGLRSLALDPGNEVALELFPRFQLTPALALGAAYGYTRRGADVVEGDSAMLGATAIRPVAFPARSLQTVGVEARFSTLPEWYGGGRVLPVEVRIAYRTAIAGSGGAPRAARLEIFGQFYQSLWGARRRAPAEGAAPRP